VRSHGLSKFYCRLSQEALDRVVTLVDDCEIHNVTPLGLHGVQQVDGQYFPCNFLLTSESPSCQTAYRLDFCAYRLDISVTYPVESLLQDK